VGGALALHEMGGEAAEVVVKDVEKFGLCGAIAGANLLEEERGCSGIRHESVEEFS
jgi:hypothetical protein